MKTENFIPFSVNSTCNILSSGLPTFCVTFCQYYRLLPRLFMYWLQCY